MTDLTGKRVGARNPVPELRERIEQVRADALAALDASEVEQVTLTEDLAYALPAGVGPNRVHSVVFTQDATGGHTVAYGGAPVTVDTTAGAVTTVEFVPTGASRVVRYPLGRDPSLLDSAAVLGGTATDGGSLAVGRSATTGTFPTSTAVGQKATAGSGVNGTSTAVGASAQAVDQGTALGALTKATGSAGALAVGRAAEALGNPSTAVGTGAKANGNHGVALGNASIAALLGTSLGSNAETGTGGVAVGYGAKATEAYSVAIGRDTVTTAPYQLCIGPRHIALASPASAPSAPPSGGRLYTRLNGNNKHELVVRFLTGAVQVIATEP